MKNKFSISFIVLALSAIIITGCTVEYPNPNAATKDEVLKSADGLMGLAVGMKTSWTVGGASGLYSQVVSNGLTTQELVVLNTGNATLAALEAGKGSLNGANSTMANLWTSGNLVKSYAQLLIDNAGVVGDVGTRSGVESYGLFFKALAIGTLGQFWEQVTTQVITSAEYINGVRPAFKPRVATLEEAIGYLRQAESKMAQNPVSAAFYAKVGRDIDLPSATQALIARYSLMLNKLDEASAAADKAIAANVVSSFKFDVVNQNPVFRSGLVSNNVVGGALNFGLKGSLAPAATDGRIAFYLGGTTLSRATGFFKGDLDAIPVYLPGEMILIKAEVNARKSNLPDAIIELNKILTKTTDPLGVTARLPAYSGANTQNAILLEIYKQRCIELYMSGLKLEDNRRFGRPGPLDAGSERNRNFYPYPNVERDNNAANTPKDPDV